MADKINREEVNGIKNVYSVDYTQKTDSYTKENSDVVTDTRLYYTDLDISDNAELFTTVSEAKQKADDMIRKFPNHIVKFYMFYYTETYDGNGELSGVRQELCQVVPGTQNAQDDRYRDVKRKNLKKAYDKIDFITIYRPLNGIKWYTVSKEELATELAVIKDFYGLTNFPDKVGDYYFSKKIGKWLATKELGAIIADYEAQNREIPVIYIDEGLENGYIKAEKKTIFQLFWEWLVGVFEGIGSFFKSILGILFNKKNWEKLFENIDKDGNNIPDGMDDFNRWLEDLGKGNEEDAVKWKDVFTFQKQTNSLQQQLNDAFQKRKNEWQSFWSRGLWNNIKDIINNNLDLEIPEDEEENNNT